MIINQSSQQLTQGATLQGDVLTLPAAGGGFRLDELARTTERYLNFCIELLEEHSMAFELRAYGAEDEPRVVVRFGVMPRFPAHICIDLNWLDGHILFPGHQPGELKVVCHGSRIARGEIRQALLVSMPAYHDIRVRINEIELSDQPAAPSPISDAKLIDELGQYIPKTWPGKVDGPEALRRLLLVEAERGADAPQAGRTAYGGCSDQKLCEGTGYFTRIKREGRWYLADPDGYAFFSMGPDCVRIGCDARVDGLEPLLRWLPEPGEPAYADMEPMWREFGEVERPQGKLFSFERANLRRAFGDGWYEAWRGMVVGQLRRYGLNTVGNWSDETLFGRMPYVTSLPRFPETAHTIFRDFPDVYAPEYEADAAACAQALLPRRDDPMMIGYFLRNEPSWAFVDNLVLADEVLRDPADTHSKRALIEWLRERYGDAAALNRAWHTAFASLEELTRPIEGASALSAQAEADLRAFSARMIERYTAIPAKACRAVDPHHMILGMRWAWISDPALITGWDCFDVFSINCYAVDPTAALERVRELGVDLPVMIGEYHFGALDAGLTATGLEAVPTQRERGVAYRYYTEHAAAHPLCVGCHYFQCYDQFALGRFDGENYNIGLFDVCFQPYAELMDASRACSETIYAVMDGSREPTDQQPRTIPMIAY